MISNHKIGIVMNTHARNRQPPPSLVFDFDDDNASRLTMVVTLVNCWDASGAGGGGSIGDIIGLISPRQWHFFTTINSSTK